MLVARGKGGGRVGGRWGTHYYALKYTDFILLIVKMAVMDVSFFLFFFFFVFSRKNRRSRVCIIEVKKQNDTNT